LFKSRTRHKTYGALYNSFLMQVCDNIKNLIRKSDFPLQYLVTNQAFVILAK